MVTPDAGEADAGEADGIPAGVVEAALAGELVARPWTSQPLSLIHISEPTRPY